MSLTPNGSQPSPGHGQQRQLHPMIPYSQPPHPQNHHHPYQQQQQQQQSYPPYSLQQPHAMPPFPQQTQYPPQYMMNRGPSSNAQGLYSTYPARLRQSDDNALLLPTSYLTARKPKFTGESDDDFDDLMEESDEGTPSSGPRTRSGAQQANARASTPQQPAPGGQVMSTQDLRKSIRKKSHFYPSEDELDRASKMEEVLVPIRLDIDMDDVKLRDAFLWNMNEQFLTPEKFAEMLCEDLDLPVNRFMATIAESIRQQVVDFEAIHEVELPPNSIRVVINLDLQVGKINLRDRFEWDLDNTANNAPEVFSKQLAAEVGLGGEYVSIIAHAIREQLYRHKRQWVDEQALDDELVEPLRSGFRGIEDAETWAPQMEMLSNEELEKLLIAQERNMRRLRRETRFKRSRRRMSVTPRP